MFMTSLVTSFLFHTSPVTDSQRYFLQTSQSGTLLEVVVPFQKVITLQSYILRVCPRETVTNEHLKLSATLDNHIGSSLDMANGCQLIDFAVSLKRGLHTVTLAAGSNDTASFTFDVVDGSRLDFGTVSSGRYTDWSILRSKKTVNGDYVLCSLSQGLPKDATLVAFETGEILSSVTVQQRPNDPSCYDVSGAYAERDGIYELHIRLSNARSIVFPIDNRDANAR